MVKPKAQPAAAVDAAWAAQPDGLLRASSVVVWLLALVLGGVPPGLDEDVVRVRQRLHDFRARRGEALPCISCKADSIWCGTMRGGT